MIVPELTYYQIQNTFWQALRVDNNEALYMNAPSHAHTDDETQSHTKRFSRPVIWDLEEQRPRQHTNMGLSTLEAV